MAAASSGGAEVLPQRMTSREAMPPPALPARATSAEAKETATGAAKAKDGSAKPRQKNSPERQARQKDKEKGGRGGKGPSKGGRGRGGHRHRQGRGGQRPGQDSTGAVGSAAAGQAGAGPIKRSWPGAGAGGSVAGPIKRHNKAIYAYGNYDQYYAQRHDRHASVDARIQALLKANGAELFAEKAVLDLGCGEGFMTLLIASLGARRVEGIDIDAAPISKALKSLRRLKAEGHRSLPLASEDSVAGSRFPMSFVQAQGIVPYACKPLIPGAAATALRDAMGQKGDPKSGAKQPFPYNVEFRTENFLVSEIEERRGELYDVVMCLKLTKWIHLHWGDEGIKVLLYRCFRLLRPGGFLVLESEPWSSYNSSKHLTPQSKQNYSLIQFRPEEFSNYLVNVIGFEEPKVAGSCPPLKRPVLLFRRPLLLVPATRPVAPFVEPAVVAAGPVVTTTASMATASVGACGASALDALPAASGLPHVATAAPTMAASQTGPNAPKLAAAFSQPSLDFLHAGRGLLQAAIPAAETIALSGDSLSSQSVTPVQAPAVDSTANFAETSGSNTMTLHADSVAALSPAVVAPAQASDAAPEEGEVPAAPPPVAQPPATEVAGAAMPAVAAPALDPLIAPETLDATGTTASSQSIAQRETEGATSKDSSDTVETQCDASEPDGKRQRTSP